jgi:WD40 repeat protein
VQSTSPVFSPDGRRIAFMRGRNADFPPDEIWVMNANGSDARKLASFASNPVWSPDSGRIAYSSGSLTIVNLRSGRRIAVPGRYLWPSWSPNGKRLVVVVDRRDALDLAVVGADARGLKVVRRDVSGSSPIWLANGLIAFGDELIHPDGRRARRLRLPGPVVWAHDGRRFAFADHGGLRLKVGSPGGAVRDVTPRGGGVFGALAWSPDERWLAAQSRPRSAYSGHGPRGSLFVVAADGSSSRRVAGPGSYPYGGDNTTPAWQPRGAGAARVGRIPANPSPAESAARAILRSSGPIVGLAADGARVAVAVGSSPSDCPHVSVWNPGTRPVHLGIQEPCVHGNTSVVPDAVGLAGKRAAWVERLADPAVADLFVRTSAVAMPARIAQVDHVWNSSELCCGGGFAGNLHGDGDLLVYDSWTACMADSPENGTPPPCTPDGEPWGRTTVKNTRLWRLVGARRTLIRAGEGAFEATGADAGRVAVLEPSGSVDVVAADGSLIHRLALPRGRALAALLSDSRLVVLTSTTLEEYDAATGAAAKTLPLGVSANRMLADFDGGIAVYVDGRTVHVLRIADGRSTAFTLPGPARCSRNSSLRGSSQRRRSPAARGPGA